MKTIIKTALISTVLASASYGATYEHYQLYKDPKIMGMGGANIATGGLTTSLFYNTAGLSKIPKDYGLEVGILDISASINENIMDFATDLGDAEGETDAQENKEVLKVVEEYQGKNNHFSTTMALVTIGKKFDEYAFGIVPFGGAIVNMKSHSGFGSDGVMETNGMAYGGAALGISKDIKDLEIGNYVLNNLAVGLGAKTVTYNAWNHSMTIAELVNNKDDMGDYFTDTIAKDGSSAVLDLGAQYEVYPDVQVGLAVQNIGGIGDAEAIEIPMTVGAGVSYSKRVPENILFNSFQVAFDYTDMFNAYDDEDFMKRTRLGVSGQVIEGWVGELGLSAGMYQGYYTAGIQGRLFAVKISYATYAEEVGAYSGQDEDRRHIFNFHVGF